jgi:Arm DNA-binding domain
MPMALTDVRIKAAKPAANAYRLVDARGLHLFVTPQGGKLWRLRNKVAGREKMLSFGAYPEVTLAVAREARDAAREELRSGRDPALAKRHRRATAAAHAAGPAGRRPTPRTSSPASSETSSQPSARCRSGRSPLPSFCPCCARSRPARRRRRPGGSASACLPCWSMPSPPAGARPTRPQSCEARWRPW